MRIRIKPDKSSRLPVIRDLPNYPLARMEGYNGIGKSLTVRLLQLCTGVQPYRSTRPWQGLRDGLGVCEICIDELEDVGEVRWNLDSRRWPEAGGPVNDEWDGFDVLVDGNRSTLARVASLVSVHRLAGDVGLTETLGEQVEADRLMFRSWATPLTDYEGSPLRAVEDCLAAATDLIVRVDPDATMQVRCERLAAEKELANVRAELEAMTARQNALADALQLRERVKELRGTGEAVDERIAGIDAELQELAGPRAELADEIAKLEQDAARGEEAARDLKNAQKRLKRHREALEQQLESLADLAETAGVDYREQAAVNDAQVAADRVAAALVGAQRDLNSLLERRAAIDAAPLMAALLDDLAARLERAEDAGLGRQSVIDSTDAVPLTVADVRQRVQDRRSAIAIAEPSEQGVALAEQINRVVDVVRALESIGRVREEVARRSRLATDADNDIRKLVANQDTGAAARLDDLVRRRGELDAMAQALAFERTALHKRKQAGPSDVESLEHRLAEAAQDVGTTVEHLADELQLQAAAARDAQIAFRAAEEVAKAAAVADAQREQALGRVVAALNDDAQLAWLRGAQPALVPAPGTAVDAQLAALRRLAAVVSHARERAGRARNQVLGIDNALGLLHDRLIGRPEAGDGMAYLEELTRGYGKEFAAWFDEPHVRTELFQSARRVSSVDLRRDRLEVLWEDQGGGVRSRPLEAFSRGEQAFAYTRARLAELDVASPRARNRLIVLDEFGAFIARDRLATLISMLADRRDAATDDQHLLILPVAADYEEAARSAPIKQRKRLESHARDLREHGFFFEKL